MGLYSAAYFKRIASTGIITTVRDKTLKSFSKCASDCDYLYWVTDQNETCHVVSYDMDTKRCTLALIDMSVIPGGDTKEIFAKHWFTGCCPSQCLRVIDPCSSFSFFFPDQTYWYEIKRLYGKDYFMPRFDRNASDARAKCKEMGGHPAAILTMDDSKAVREIGKMCAAQFDASTTSV